MGVSWLTSGSLSWLKKNQKTLFKKTEDFPGGPVVKNPLASAGDMGLIPGLRRLHMPWGSQIQHHNYWNPGTLGPELYKRSHRNKKPWE